MGETSGMSAGSSQGRVVHVIPTVATLDGGPVEALLRLHETLLEQGVHSAIVSTDRRLVGGDPVRTVSNLELARSRPPDRLNFATGLKGELRKAFRSADVVHVHAVNNYVTTVACRQARTMGLPIVLQPHGAFDSFHRKQNAVPKSVYYRVFDERAFRSCASVIASSEREAAGVRSVLDVEPVVIPLGVDPTLFDIGDDHRRSRSVLFLGRLTEKKRVDVAIRAFARSGLWRVGGVLTIAGPVDPRLTYDPVEVARHAGVLDHVEFVGAVDRNERRQLLARSQTFLLPSKDESFGVSAAEAMASGCVVVATNEVGVVPEAARAGAAVAAESEQQFATAIRELSHDSERLARIAWRARQYASREFNWRALGPRFGRLYRNAISDARGGQ